MVNILEPSDLTPFAEIDEIKAAAMIEDAEAMAALVAPCIKEPGFDNYPALRAVLRGAILRWNESGTGAIQSQAAGPFSQTFDNRQERRSMFWPSEIEQLQNLCGRPGSTYTLSLAGPESDSASVRIW